MSFLRHKQNRLYSKNKLGTKVPSPPYLANLFLISCSPAELISALVGKNKSKPILGLNKKCKFVSGLSVKLSKNCKLFSGRVNLLQVVGGGTPTTGETVWLLLSVISTGGKDSECNGEYFSEWRNLLGQTKLGIRWL